LGALGPG